MQVSVENTGDLQRRVKVVVPAGDVDSKIDSRIRQMGSRVRMDGFRPGRVPMKVVQKRYGPQVEQEVINEVLQESFRQALQDNELRPVGTPEIDAEKHKRGQDFTYVATFEVLPQLDTIDVAGLNVDKVTADVGDKDIDGMIETLQLQRQRWSDLDEPAADDHLVVFEYSAENDEIGRVPEEGTERAGAVLGKGTLSKPMEKMLVGLKVGDEKSGTVNFLKDFKNEKLAGQKAKVSLKVVSVSELDKPEVDEEFIKSFGVESGNMDDFRKDVRANLERELRQAVNGKNKQAVIDALLEANTNMALPTAVIDDEMNNLRQQAEQRGMQVPGDEELRSSAEKRVRSALLLSEIARQQDIQPSDEGIRELLQDIASTYDEPDEVLKIYLQNPQAMEHLRNTVLEDQVVEAVLEQAKVTEKASSFDELLRRQ
jgi:trigger factor